MIPFRCWYCNRGHSRSDADVGKTLLCGCEYTLRVPREPNGNRRVYTFTDWLVQTVVYGGGGALLGFGLALVILAAMYRALYIAPPLFVDGLLFAGLTLAGFLAGLFLGEPGINRIGRLIREWSDHR